VTWWRDVGLGGQEQPDPYAWGGQRESLLWLIASFMGGSCERISTSTFVTNSYQKMPSIRLWFAIWKASCFVISAFNSVHVSLYYRQRNIVLARLRISRLEIFASCRPNLYPCCLYLEKTTRSSAKMLGGAGHHEHKALSFWCLECCDGSVSMEGATTRRRSSVERERERERLEIGQYDEKRR